MVNWLVPKGWSGGQHTAQPTKLRVADASIIPNVMAGNTNLPTIMAAEKMPTQSRLHSFSVAVLH